MQSPLPAQETVADQQAYDSVAALTDALKHRALDLGFSLVGVVPAVSPFGHEHFTRWLERGFAGEMRYMEERREAYAHPRSVLPSVRSIVMLALNYLTKPLSTQRQRGYTRVSKYAWGTTDYHSVIRERLVELSAFLHTSVPGCTTRGVVDTAPLLERDFARLAGLGWFGKNTMLINKRQGSWLFLAGLLTDVELMPDAPHETSHCGTCTRCLDACPTSAFPQPYVLDATRCISYLTIELRNSPIPPDLREACGDWLFGCDICQDVCPWNRKAPTSSESACQPRQDLAAIDAAELLKLDEAAFRDRFRGSSLLRSGRAGLLRNACIVLGNTGDASYTHALTTALDDTSELVRGAAAWALGAVGGESAKLALLAHRDIEVAESVRREVDAALQRWCDS